MFKTNTLGQHFSHSQEHNKEIKGSEGMQFIFQLCSQGWVKHSPKKSSIKTSHAITKKKALTICPTMKAYTVIYLGSSNGQAKALLEGTRLSLRYVFHIVEMEGDSDLIIDFSNNKIKEESRLLRGHIKLDEALGNWGKFIFIMSKRP